jgi:hypothetical protein
VGCFVERDDWERGSSLNRRRGEFAIHQLFVQFGTRTVMRTDFLVVIRELQFTSYQYFDNAVVLVIHGSD